MTEAPPWDSGPAGDSVPAVVWESLSVLAERGHAGVTLGKDPRGEPPLFVRAGPVCVCARVFARGPRGQRPSLRHAVGPPSEGHGMGLGVHPLTRPNRFAWEENAQKTVGMCPQVPRERLLGLPLPPVEAAREVKSRRSRSGACSPSGYVPPPRSSLPAPGAPEGLVGLL